jgi:hypothetical protein
MLYKYKWKVGTLLAWMSPGKLFKPFLRLSSGLINFSKSTNLSIYLIISVIKTIRSLSMSRRYLLK